MKKVLIALLVSLFSSSAHTTIWVRNGNFSLEFVDINLGHGFELTRFYNSLGFGSSFFGNGWGTTHGMNLNSVAGVMVMVEEMPGGGRSHYIVGDNIGRVADRIIELSKVGEGRSDAYIKRLKERLMVDPMILYEFARRYDLSAPPREGLELQCIERPGEKLRRTSTGYIRERLEGVTDEFDRNGNLIRQRFDKDRFLFYSYNPRGFLQSVRDQAGRTMRFSFDEKRGLLQRVQATGDLVASYKYDDRGNLVESTDARGNTYRYAYNAHNKMIEYIEPPLTPGGEPRKWEMRYEGNTGRITFQRTPDGMQTHLEYSSDRRREQHYEVVTMVKRRGTQVISEKYEFWKRPKPDGSMYTYRVRETRGGRTKTTTFTMCCATPLVIDDNGEITRFEYDEKSRLRKKVFPDGRIVEVRYDEKDRITSIINNGNPNMFSYDDKGRLQLAVTETIRFRLDYDQAGNVSRVTDNKNNTFELRYDQLGRVISIMSKYGTLNMNYDQRGVASISSTEGTKENLGKIRGVYQDYMDVINLFSLIALN